MTPRTQEAFADAIRNVSAEELAMLETPRRGSIEITSLQRVESVARRGTMLAQRGHEDALHHRDGQLEGWANLY